jgi:hypothetical protein
MPATTMPVSSLVALLVAAGSKPTTTAQQFRHLSYPQVI